MAKLLFVFMDEISEKVILNESKEIFSEIETIDYKATALYKNKSRYFHYFDQKGLNPEHQRTVVYLCNEDILNLSYKIVKSPNGHGSNYDSFLCSKNELDSLISKFNLQKVKSIQRRTTNKVKSIVKKEKSTWDTVFTKVSIQNIKNKGYNIYDFCILENSLKIGVNGNLRSFSFMYKGKEYSSDIQWFKEARFSEKFLFDVYTPEERISKFLYTRVATENFKSSTSSLKRCLFDIIDVEYEVKTTVAVKSVKIFCKITEKEFIYSANSFRKAMMHLQHKQAVNNCFEKQSKYRARKEDALPGGFKLDVPAIFYYVKIIKDGEIVWKVGITNRTVELRHTKDFKYMEVLLEIPFEIGQDALDLEQYYLNFYDKAKRKHVTGVLNLPKKLIQSGNTEIMMYDILANESFVAMVA